MNGLGNEAIDFLELHTKGVSWPHIVGINSVHGTSRQLYYSTKGVITLVSEQQYLCFIQLSSHCAVKFNSLHVIVGFFMCIRKEQ